MNGILGIKPNRRRLDSESEFFLLGNVERFQAFRNSHPTATTWVDDANWIAHLAVERTFKCLETGCCQEFNSIRKFEEHKFKCHSHQCSVCSRSFTTDRLLSFHLSELHDSYFAALSKRKASYACLVESCTELFWSDLDRREHLIKQHHFHASYDFHDPKKFLRKFQLQLQHKKHIAEHGDQHMNVDTSPPQKATATRKSPNNKHQETPTAAGTALPGGNRAQRRAMKRAEFETTHVVSSDTAIPAHTSSQSNSSHIAGGAVNGQDNVSSRDAGIAHNSSAGGVAQSPSQISGARAGSDSHRGAITAVITAVQHSKSLPASVQSEGRQNVSIDSMEVDDGLDGITQSLRTTSIHVPSRISFGRRKGHH